VPYQVQGTWHLSQTVWDTPNHIPVAVPGDPIEVYAEGPYTIWTADAAVGASASGHRQPFVKVIEGSAQSHFYGDGL